MNPTLRYLRACGLALFLVGCSETTTGPATETILVRIQGAVTSGVDGSPVQGASVTLGSGGHFTLPVDLATVSTDAQGHYHLERSVSVQRNGCGLWIRASAPGFQVQGGAGSSSLRPHCGSALQRIDIVLQP